MLRLMMVAAIIAVGFFSMKSCDSVVSMQNKETLQYKERIQEKLQQSEDLTQKRLQQSEDLYQQQQDRQSP